jgi:hypothetical protein
MKLSGWLTDPATLPPEKEPQYPLHRRLGGLQSQSGHYREEKNLALAQNRTPATQTIAIQTELSQQPTAGHQNEFMVLQPRFPSALMAKVKHMEKTFI